MPRSVIEDDGIPEQDAPRVRGGEPVVDDPTEPFSPNYGSVRIAPRRSRMAPTPPAVGGQARSGRRTAVNRASGWRTETRFADARDRVAAPIGDRPITIVTTR